MIRINGSIVIIIMLLLLASVTANAQFIRNPNPEYRLVHKWFTATDGEDGVSTITYDSKGRPVKELWHLLDGTRSSLNLFQFDVNGNMISKERLFSDQRNSMQTFRYDSRNNLVKETFDRVDGVKGEAVYEYDSEGKLIKVDCRRWNGWFVGSVLFEYDGQGRVVSASIERDERAIGSIEYVYNDLGNMETETWQFNNGYGYVFRYDYDKLSDAGNKHFTYSNVFVVPQGDEQVIAERYDYSGKINGYCDNQVFDNSGALQYKEYKRSDGFITKTDYFYDVRNRLTKSYRRYPDGKTAIFVYKVDENDRIANKLFYRSDGVRGHEDYTYSNEGLLTKADWENFDSWLTGTLEFSHDESGKITRGIFKGEKFDAGIEFSYDDAGRIIRIHWTFSNDDTQTYEFEWGEVEG